MWKWATFLTLLLLVSEIKCGTHDCNAPASTLCVSCTVYICHKCDIHAHSFLPVHKRRHWTFGYFEPLEPGKTVTASGSVINFGKFAFVLAIQTYIPRAKHGHWQAMCCCFHGLQFHAMLPPPLINLYSASAVTIIVFFYLFAPNHNRFCNSRTKGGGYLSHMCCLCTDNEKRGT